MARKVRILFVKNITISFVEQDIDLLKSKFDVRVVDFILSKRSPISKCALLVEIVRGMMWADFVFSWFADLHGMLSVLLAKIFKKKSILVAGGYDVAIAPQINYGMAMSLRQVVVAKLALRYADKVIAVSEFNRNETLRWARAEKVELIYNAVDCNKFRPGGKKVDDLVIMVSEVSWQNLRLKGLEVFLRTAAYLPSLRFALIGRASDKSAEYLKKIKPPNVELTCRHLPFEELLEWYQKAKVYCQISYRESFGVSLAEAMACGCIPVVTNRGALPELAGEIGVYVPYGDPEATGKAVKEALRLDKQTSARKRIQELFPIEKRRRMLVEIITRELK